jgi:AraC-like DNA-binding protein
MGGVAGLDKVPWDVRTSDLTQFRSQVSRCLKPYRFVSRCSDGYDAAIVRRRIEALDFMIIRYGNRVTIDAGRLDRLPLLQVPLSGSYRVHSEGRSADVATRTAHLLPPGFPLVMEWSSDCALLVIRLDATAWSEQQWTDGIRRSAQTEFGSFISLDEGPFASLGHLINFLVAELLGGTTLWANRQLAVGAESLLTTMLSNAFRSESYSLSIRKPSPILLRAQESLMNQLHEDQIDIDAIADTLHISTRTLYRLFNSEYSIGPQAWARNIRLAQAREAIMNASSELTVTDIALNFGFCHLGRFAKDYRRKFGETPSCTRRSRRT